MVTREIPRDEWLGFFDAFSRQHQGWLVTIEVLGFDVGAQVASRNLSLEGISADVKGKENGISMTLGKEPDAHITHIITEPTHVRLAQTEAGTHAALQIESASGTTTLLSFRSAVLPEMVNGIVSE